MNVVWQVHMYAIYIMHTRTHTHTHTNARAQDPAAAASEPAGRSAFR